MLRDTNFQEKSVFLAGRPGLPAILAVHRASNRKQSHVLTSSPENESLARGNGHRVAKQVRHRFLPTPLAVDFVQEEADR